MSVVLECLENIDVSCSKSFVTKARPLWPNLFLEFLGQCYPFLCQNNILASPATCPFLHFKSLKKNTTSYLFMFKPQY